MLLQFKMVQYFVYSIQKDAIFCFPCRLFTSQSHKGETTFIVNGLRDWKKIRSKTDKLASSETHKNSVTLWAGYMQAKRYGTVGDRQIVTEPCVFERTDNFEDYL